MSEPIMRLESKNKKKNYNKGVERGQYLAKSEKT